ncbi:hypothetical protein EVAR_59593_1 [Eumeta japonica]|uniref:Retrovirus-related Pol polyprotein from transposon TNT 1-94 n=1 Tax=Eumeta variegata TaxID=151549 RepID=A0A4C1Z666_EUMVA|nr:hypothetical protein EVAR_59593_1 [Eumeta japonica]
MRSSETPIELETGIPVDPKRDLKTKSKIILLVDSMNYVHIQETTTAKVVWDKLASAFDDSGLTRRVGLLRDLCITNLNGCNNVEQYMSKIITTAHKLRNIDFKVDDEWLGILLLFGLPEIYRPMIIAINSSDQEKLQIIDFDVTTAFLYGQLNENILMTPPEGLDCKPNIKADDKPKKDHPYREAVGSLIHAATVSRPDVMFAVSQWGQQRPQKEAARKEGTAAIK